MRVLISVFILFLYMPCPLIGQPDSTNFYLKEYVNIFDSLSALASSQKTLKDFDLEEVELSGEEGKFLYLQKSIETMPLDDFLDIIEKRILAYEEDIFQPKEYWLRHDEGIAQLKDIDSVRFGLFEGLLSAKLEELYGDLYCSLILSPMLIKVHVKNIRSEVHKVDNDRSIGLTILTAEIEDIVKGQSFSRGEMINFYYIPAWQNTNKNLVNNNSYFLSLTPVISNKTGEKRLALNVNNVNDGFVKISENIVQDMNNDFGFGNIPWEDFKRRLTQAVSIKYLREAN